MFLNRDTIFVFSDWYFKVFPMFLNKRTDHKEDPVTDDPKEDFITEDPKKNAFVDGTNEGSLSQKSSFFRK